METYMNLRTRLQYKIKTSWRPKQSEQETFNRMKHKFQFSCIFPYV